MKYKLLGKSGIRVSELSLGCMTFGEEWGFGVDKAESQRVFDAYLQAGGNFLDTANVYTKGTSESYLGEFIQAERDNLVVASKFTLSEDTKINRAGNHKKNMVHSVEESLKRLNTDYIDLYYIHAWDFSVGEDELMRSLEHLVSSGKVLNIGISDTPAWIVAKSNTIAELRGWSSFVAYQIEYSLTERSAEREMLPMAESYDMSVCAWGPLAAGLLSGKYLKEGIEPRRMVKGQGRRLTEANLALSAKLLDMAAELGCTPAQLALNWTRAQSPNMITLFGARNEKQCLENLACLDHELPDEYLLKLDELSKIELGFPHEFLETDRVREIIYGDHYKNILF